MYANGTEAELEYDDVAQLTKLVNKESDATVISSFEYEYDKAGSRTKLTKPDETVQYTYDNLYQVTEVYSVTDQLVLEEFDYDAAGNRTSDADYDDYTYNDNNQLTTYDSGDTDLEYDDNGNMTKKTVGVAVTTHTYDQDNQLVRIDYPNAEYSAYRYGPLGRRIATRDRSGNIAHYYYDGFDMVAGYNGADELVAHVTFGPGIDNPISLHHDGDVYNYHTDALGSVTELTDAAEAVAQTYEYSSFGQILTQSGSLTTINPFTYTAREFDSESGLYYNRYRYYSADVGRFITYDPIGWAGGVNLYVYVGNNPLNFIDPFGFCSNWLDWFQGGLDAAGLVPGFGEPADLANAGISALRGNWGDAGLSALSAIPFIGYVGTAGKGAKYAKKFGKASDALDQLESISRARKAARSGKAPKKLRDIGIDKSQKRLDNDLRRVNSEQDAIDEGLDIFW